MNPQGLLYERVNSRLFLQNKENFDPVSKTFAGTRRNNNFRQRRNSKLNYALQRHYRDPLTEIFMNTYQQEDSYITIDTEAVAAEITTTQEKTKKKKSRTIKPTTKPKTESLLKLR